jgi:TnpA family transposase
MSTIQVLTPAEIRNYETPPHFSDAQQKEFLLLPPGLTALCETLRNPRSKIALVVQCGYFRAAHRFFGAQFYPADIAFVAHTLSLPTPTSWAVPKQTLQRQRQSIAHFFGWRSLTEAEKELLATEIAAWVKQFHRPAEVFRHTLHQLQHRKLILPGYPFLAHAISREVYRRKLALSHIIKESLSAEQKLLLDSLLARESAHPELAATPAVRPSRAQITLLKHPAQSLKPADIKANLSDWKLLHSLYEQFAHVLAKLDLSSEALRYYAHAVLQSELFQLARQPDETRYLHLLAFIAAQTFRYQDALVDAFLHTVQNITNSATQELQAKLLRERQEKRTRLRAFLHLVQTEMWEPGQTAAHIVAAHDLLADEKIAALKPLLVNFQAVSPQLASQLAQLLHETEAVAGDLEFYQILQQKSLTLQKRTADIIRLLRVDEKTVTPALFEALQYFQATDGHLERNAPRAFLSSKEQKALAQSDPKFPVALYKVLLFQKIAQGIKSGQVNFTASHKYRALEDYLIPHAEWQANSLLLLEKAELSGWHDWLPHSAQLATRTRQAFVTVNQNLKDNAWFKRKAGTGWSIATPPVEKAEHSGLKHYFPGRQMISLGEVFATVCQATNVLEEFTPGPPASHHKRPAQGSFCAAIVGLGCEIGVGQMSQIAKNVVASELAKTVNWYLSHDNLLAANARLVDFIGQLELANRYRRWPDQLHTSSDGQKYEVSVPSLNANYSFKYFGQNKGVSVYSFIDERHLLFYATVISSSEREAAYVIDGLLHNEALRSDLHSTDSHGFTEVVFAVTHLLGFTFAPRLKSLCGHQLYCFEKRKEYTALGLTVLPAAAVNTRLIADNWDAILRFVATIKLKRTSASQLFKRLNSYAHQHPLYQALKEFGKIIKTLFILRYIDDVGLRQAIEKQLNKIEHAQRFAKAVGFGNNQEFSEGDKERQEVSANCRRLLENMVICWNYLYLTQKLTELSGEEERQTLLRMCQNSSIITWQHINFHGEYDFSEEKTKDSIGFDVPAILSWKGTAK